MLICTLSPVASLVLLLNRLMAESKGGTSRHADRALLLLAGSEILRLCHFQRSVLGAGKPDKATQRPHISCGSPAAPAEPIQESTPRIPSFTLSTPKDVTTTLLDVGKQASMSRRAKAALASGEAFLVER